MNNDNETIDHYDSTWARSLLFALQSKLVYLGPEGHVAERRAEIKKSKNRAKNRLAGHQRQTNRKNGSGV